MFHFKISYFILVIMTSDNKLILIMNSQGDSNHELQIKGSFFFVFAFTKTYTSRNVL